MIDFRTAFKTVSQRSLSWELRKPELNKQREAELENRLDLWLTRLHTTAECPAVSWKGSTPEANTRLQTRSLAIANPTQTAPSANCQVIAEWRAAEKKRGLTH